MVYCNTKVQDVDVLTKALKFDRFKMLREMLGVVSLGTFVLKGSVKV